MNTRRYIGENVILCMFSGGLDSTAALYKLLTDKEYDDYDIYVHHIQIINAAKRHKAEKVAVDNIVKQLRQGLRVRPFKYSTSTVNTEFLHTPGFRGFMSDVCLVAFIASQICLRNHNIRKFVIGVTNSDKRNPGTAIRNRTIQSIFDAALTEGYPETVEYPTYYQMVGDLSKQELWDLLPNNLIALTHSCRKPSYLGDRIFPCNKCKTCIEINNIKKG